VTSDFFDGHRASRGLTATAKLLVGDVILLRYNLT